MKNLLISFCEDCPHLTIVEGRFIEGEDNKLEIYECINSKAEDNHSPREITRSDKIPKDEPLFIPEWCPLEECTIKKRIVHEY